MSLVRERCGERERNAFSYVGQTLAGIDGYLFQRASFLVSFASPRNVNENNCLSVRPRMSELENGWKDFNDIWYCRILREFWGNLYFHLDGDEWLASLPDRFTSEEVIVWSQIEPRFLSRPAIIQTEPSLYLLRIYQRRKRKCYLLY
jgi:hypothetical protein